MTLATLRYMAKGDFFSETGDIHGISKSSVSRSVSTVVAAINRRLNNVHFPVDWEQQTKIKRSFYSIGRLPNVLGAIDGTLIPIQAPTADEAVYVCRKGYHAINVQAVVGPDMRFIDVVCKWPGSQHDASIFDSCALRNDYLEHNNIGWLLGDSGYPLKRYLMTPIPHPGNEAEEKYNVAHCKTRVVVERSFGVLKSRFRCLHKSGGCLPFTPDKCGQVVMACMRLHNKCIDMKLPVPAEIPEVNGDNEEIVFNGRNDGNGGRQIRQQLINNFT